MTESDYSFMHYLSAKKSVDDRAINRQVWDTLADLLPNTSLEKDLHVLEVGAGIGSMMERMIERDLLNYAQYTAIDVQQAIISYAKLHLPIWAQGKGFLVEDHGAGGTILGNGIQVEYRLEAIDLLEFITQYSGKRTWDLIVAHAFLDLMNLERVLPQLLTLCAVGGHLYCSLNYDGLTIFEPIIDPTFDQQVLDAYNETMDRRVVGGVPSGDSQTGRHLFKLLDDAGVEIIAAGSSDWVVFAQPEGYQQDEAYFLHFIIDTVDKALNDNPDIDQGIFADWIAERHAQVDRGDLVYIAHQIDFVCKRIQ
jgi:SAM-dependent methyltransferase